MQSHCQHNLYICHCSPSSQDPSPIHPLASNGGGGGNTSAANHLQTTTLHRFPVKRNGNGNVVHESGNGQLKARPVYVSHSSVAVMTSPTLHITTTTSGNGGVAGTMPKKVPPPNVDLFATSTSKKGTHSVDLLNMQEASISPSTASSCSSLQNGVVVSKMFFLNVQFLLVLLIQLLKQKNKHSKQKPLLHFTWLFQIRLSFRIICTREI